MSRRKIEWLHTIYTLALKKVEKYLKIRHDRKINGANYFTWIVND